MKVFRERLNELGYIQGQNVTVEYRHFEGKVERCRSLSPSLSASTVQLSLPSGMKQSALLKAPRKKPPLSW